MKPSMKRIFICVSALASFICIGCGDGIFDDSAVAVNRYSISKITTPVDSERSGIDADPVELYKGSTGIKYAYLVPSTDRKVNIGHDIPVDIELTADYTEKEIPVQFYLLNIDDLEEVENGTGSVEDVRMYYIERTPNTTISEIQPGTNTYCLTLNIPADQSKDDMTGDYKTGNFCVVGEVNKVGEAEIDAYEVYQKFRSKLEDSTYRAGNYIVVTTEYMAKPDLSIVEMNFTGGDGEGGDVLTYLDLDLGKLPGADEFTINVPGLDLDTSNVLGPFHIIPSEEERTFMGTVHLLSSSCDALNVPVEFYLESKVPMFNCDGKEQKLRIKLQIYDSDIGGWVDTYYVPLMKANVIERVSLALLVPDDGDLEYTSYSCGSGDMDAMTIREAIGDGDDVYTSYAYQIVGDINSGGTVKEARFMSSKTGVYNANGESDVTANNEITQDVTINIDRMEVEPNEGIMVYPFDKIDAKKDNAAARADDYDNDKQLVIFWDGFQYSVGDNDFGAGAQIHEGCLFHNFSLYSLGASVKGTVFAHSFYLLNAYLNAISTPMTEKKTGFDFHVEAAGKTYFSDFGAGFSSNDWNYPITLYSKSWEKEKWVYCFKFKLTAGIDLIFTPGVRLDLNYDGSLQMDKYMTLVGSANADASVSVGGLAGVGIYAYCDVVTIELNQSTGTKTEFITGTDGYERVRGTVYRDFGMYLTGPTGYFNLYLEINFLFFSKKWEWELYRYSTFRVPIVDFSIYPNTFSGTNIEKWTTYLRY